MPMTAVDEIAYRTPDALFNGSALTTVIQSCCPGVKDAWQAPGIDITAMLIAIRLASYGTDVEVASTCPACGNNGDFTMDLQDAIGQLKVPNYDQAVSHGDLAVYFRPVSFQIQNDINTRQFEQQRTIMQVRESDLPDEEKTRLYNQALATITTITMDVVAANIAAIKTPQALVTEPEFIRDFIRNCDRKIFTQIRDHAIQLREASDLPPLTVKCTACEHEYQQPIVLDATNFFDSAS